MMSYRVVPMSHRIAVPQVTHLGAKDDGERTEWIEAIRSTIQQVCAVLFSSFSSGAQRRSTRRHSAAFTRRFS